MNEGWLIWAINLETRSASHKAVIVAVASIADAEGFGWPSQKLLAQRACCSERTVRSVLLDLEKDGIVERAPRRRPNGSFSSDGLQLRRQPAANLAAGKSCQRQNPSQPAANPAGPEEYIPSSLRSEGERYAATARADAVDWRFRLEQAQTTVNGALNLTNGASHTWTALRPLCEPTEGLPCDWDADVIPALIEVSAGLKAKGKMLHGFAHPAIKERAIANRDRRLAGLPQPVSPEPSHVQLRARTGRASLADSFTDYANDIGAAIQRRGAGVG